MQDIIFSADDFGLTESVNEAVEQAHRYGALTQTSLMVAAPAAQDAISRAKNLAGLNVGLHLVLVDGDSLLGHAKLPHITTADGKFRRNQIALGFQYFFSPAARRELAAETQAQFAAFAATGLALHHADAHKHMHMHPTVARLMIRMAREFSVKRIRVPAEPPGILRKCGARPGLGAYAMYAWSFLLRHQCRRAGLRSADYLFGIHWSGRMNRENILALVQNLPAGSSEIYTHPAIRRDEDLVQLMPEYKHMDEFEALVSLVNNSDHLYDKQKS
jgi:hopanoid biosynthesis associated protein HpnK